MKGQIIWRKGEKWNLPFESFVHQKIRYDATDMSDMEIVRKIQGNYYIGIKGTSRTLWVVKNKQGHTEVESTSLRGAVCDMQHKKYRWLKQTIENLHPDFDWATTNHYRDRFSDLKPSGLWFSSKLNESFPSRQILSKLELEENDPATCLLIITMRAQTEIQWYHS